MYVTPETSFIYPSTLMYDWHEQWVDAVLSMENPPQAISTSYADHEQTGTWLISFQTFLNSRPINFPQSQFRTRSASAIVSRSLVSGGPGSSAVNETLIFSLRCSIWWWLIGARGVSVLFAAGDGGVGDWGLENRTQHLCFSNDGRNVTKFLPGKHAASLLTPGPDTRYNF